MRQLELERELYSFDLNRRRAALQGLCGLLQSNEVAIVPELPVTNLHCHTFCSFNAYGYSPSGLAWEAKKRGLFAAGIVDFDVLHGAQEFLEACEVLGLRGTAGIESRVFIPEWKDREINSPKEPGIFYAMGVGFLRDADPASQPGQVLRSMSAMARKRNEAILERLNAFLPAMALDYERDVLPLTPSGNATERHMLVALDQRARRLFPEDGTRARLWSQALSVQETQIQALDSSPAELQMLIRSKLMKHGGPGYVPPDAGSFPTLDEMIPMIHGLGAVPTATWLDGTSLGERDPREFLDLLMSKGVACLNVIPDRNWNIRDDAERKTKVAKLHEIMAEARKRHLPVIAGTEMNKHGQKFVDDFFCEPLKPVAEEFTRGARILAGHTLLLQHLGFGLVSPEVQDRFKGDLKARNAFFDGIGGLRPASGLKEILPRAWAAGRLP